MGNLIGMFGRLTRHCEGRCYAASRNFGGGIGWIRRAGGYLKPVGYLVEINRIISFAPLSIRPA
jgi:hypothetical protein